MTSPAGRRALTVVAALALTLGGATACTTTVSGTGRAVSVAPATSSAATTADVRDADDLAGLLMDVPADTEQDTDSWARDRTPSIDDFAEQIYRDADEGADTLRGYGVTAVAHVQFSASDGTGADVALLLFDDEDQPYDWMSSETSELREAGLPRSTLDAVPTVVGYSFEPEDADDYRDTRYYAFSGRIGLLVDYFTEGDLDTTNADAWVAAQWARIA